MDIAMVTRTIQLVLAPVLIITACAIMVDGFLGRYAAISDRLRALTRERLELLRGDSAHAYTTERLFEIGVQFPDLLRRLRLMQGAVLYGYGGVAVLILDMFVIALAVATGSRGTATLALGLFLLGTTGLLLGTLLAVLEVRTSHLSVSDEAKRVAAISAAFERDDTAPRGTRQGKEVRS